MITEIKNREQLIKYLDEFNKIYVSKYNKQHTRLRSLCERLYKEGKLTKVTCQHTFLFTKTKGK